MSSPSEWTGWLEATTWAPDPGGGTGPSAWTGWSQATTWAPVAPPTQIPSAWSVWSETTTWGSPTSAAFLYTAEAGWVGLAGPHVLVQENWVPLAVPGARDPGEVIHMWTGAPTDSSAVVYTRTRDATLCRLSYSLSPQMHDAQYTPEAELPDEYGIVRHTVTGLTPNTRYYFQLTDTPPGRGEISIGPVGTIRTLGSAGAVVPHRKIVIGGCLQTNATETSALQQALAWGPDWGHFNGDFFYNGHNSLQTEAQWVGRYNSQISGTGPDLQAFLAGGVAAYELVSDHDSTNLDNGDTHLPSAPYELAGWRKSVPHLAGSGDETTRDQQWDDGRVSYFMIDCRSVHRSPGLSTDGPGKTMLGSAQKARLLDWIANNPAPFKVLISDAPWMGPADVEAKPDAWWSYANERQEIIDAFHAWGGHNEVWHGDSHLIGYATAAKNTWGGFPVLCSAAYYQSGGGRNQWTFDEVFNNSGQWTAQFGRVTLTDDGNAITRTFEGIDALTETVQFTFTTTVDTSP